MPWRKTHENTLNCSADHPDKYDISTPCSGLVFDLGRPQPNSSIPDNWPSSGDHCSDYVRAFELADCGYLLLLAEVASSSPPRLAYLADNDSRDIFSCVGTSDADCGSDLFRISLSCGASNPLVIAGWRRLTT